MAGEISEVGPQLVALVGQCRRKLGGMPVHNAQGMPCISISRGIETSIKCALGVLLGRFRRTFTRQRRSSIRLGICLPHVAFYLSHLGLDFLSFNFILNAVRLHM